ncbi:MAG: hypothetical protein WCR72_17585 [Bacteroidota bacterium]
MQLKKWLNNDKLSLGLLLGLIIPMPVGILFAVFFRFIQTQFLVMGWVRITDMLLFGPAASIIVMRYYIIKLKYVNTAKGILILTVIMILAFFFFLKNSTFILPF